MNKLRLLIPLFFLLLGISSCKKEAKHVNVDEVEVAIDIVRYEKEFFKMDAKNLDEDFAKLKQQYPEFTACYIEQVMDFGSMQDSLQRYKKLLELFATHPSILGLYDTVMKQYENVDFLQPELEDMLKRYKYHFPNKPVPTELYTYISEFGPAAITYGEDILGVSLDDYLGADYVYYPAVGFYQYQLHRLTKDNIVPNLARTLAQDLVPEDPNKDSKLIDKMIRNGKVNTIMEYLVPNADDHIISGYTREQEAWCQRYEGQVWAFFIEKELLYSTDGEDVRRNLTDGPTTQGMPIESPANTGSWLGWQICRKYIAENPENGLQKLLKEKGAQQILSKSKYKPKN